MLRISHGNPWSPHQGALVGVHRRPWLHSIASRGAVLVDSVIQTTHDYRGYIMLPSGSLLQFAIENGPVEILSFCHEKWWFSRFIVSFPINSMVDLSSSLRNKL